MGIFKRDWNKPGPGIEKDEPPKKGIALFLRVLYENYLDLLKLNFILLAFILPSASVYILWILGFLGNLALIAAVVFALPLGGAITACYYCAAKMLGDELGYIGVDFKRKYRENFLQSAVPGVLCAVFVYAWIYQLNLLKTGFIALDVFMVLTSIVVPVVFAMFMPYIFIQFAYIDLKATLVVKNCFYFMFAHMPRSFMGAVMGGVFLAVFAVNFPVTLFTIPLMLFFLFCGFSLPVLLNLMWIWPVVDKQFEIAQTIKQRREEKQ